MMRIYVPRHFGWGSNCIPIHNSGSPRSGVNVDADGDYCGRMIILPSCGKEDLSTFFYQTRRGNSHINDCVHCKPVVSYDHQIPTNFASVSLHDDSRAPFGSPQGQYTHAPTSDSEANSQVWWHEYRFVPELGKHVPVLHVVWAHCWVRSRNTSSKTVNLSYNAGCAVLYLSGYNARDTAPKAITRWSRADVDAAKGTITLQGGHTYGLGVLVPTSLSYLTEPITHERLKAILDQLWDATAMWVKVLTLKQSEMTYGRRSTLSVCSEPILPSEESKFLFSEDITIPSKIDDIATGNPRIYWKNWLIQHAYLAALESVPTLSDNSISNIIEIAGFMKSLLIDRKIEFPKRLQDAWLSYRYSYMTTKLDIEDAISFAKRYMQLGTLDQELRCHGNARTIVNGVTVRCHCELKITPKELGYLGRLWRALTTYGLTPDFYVIWDMIPYSFIVDWFIPVGDMLNVLDASSAYSEEKYSITDVLFSLSYVISDESGIYKCYSRWASQPLASLNSLYWLDKPAASSKIKLFRIFDTASLFIG